MISVVVPAYNEEEGIAELYRRVKAASQSWGESLELIVIDDGSRDRTLEILASLASQDDDLKVISLSRNFGHQAALTAGLEAASGQVIAVIDADLQDPPEELRGFIDKIRSGFDVVYAIRTKRKEGIFKRLAYWSYYRILKHMTTLDIPLDAGDFCVMRIEVLDAMRRLPERNRFVRGIRAWVGFRQTGMAYERHARFAGEPKYTLDKLFRLAIDGIFNFSYRPLQLISALALLSAAGSVLLGGVTLVQYVMNWTILGYNPHQARGWTSLILTVLGACAVQLFCLGILAEYLGRLFEEIKRRPVFVVKRRINLPAASTAETAHL